MRRLRRVDCNAAGIARRRRGRGFTYVTADGEQVTDSELRERIAALAIPPAWEQVWICADPRGHIQATGFDAAGRKQYLYHPDWRAHRDREKFARMELFARRLPRLRERTLADLERRGLVRDRVLACAVRLLDHGFFRIGTERYAEANGTFGLATLRRSHVVIEDGAAVFDYRAKGAQRHRQQVADPAVLPTIRALLRRRDDGPELLAYRNGRSWSDVESDEINEYIREVTGEPFTAKDFRTWNATVLAAVELAAQEEATTKTARKRAAVVATRRVAAYLANTPAVTRGSYIDPRVFDRFDSGETIGPALSRMLGDTEPGEFPDRERIERAVLRLIR
jgi:DNA topoisomerase-1